MSNKKFAPLAIVIVILAVAIGYNLYFQSAPPRILQKYFGISGDSLEAQIIWIVLVVIVILIGYTVSRKFRVTAKSA